jgi:hypothetical protein
MLRMTVPEAVRRKLLDQAMRGTGCLHIGHLRSAVALYRGRLECVSAGGSCTWLVRAPAGQAWAASGHQSLVVEWPRGDRGMADRAIREAVARVCEGLGKSAPGPPAP